MQVHSASFRDILGYAECDMLPSGNVIFALRASDMLPFGNA